MPNSGFLLFQTGVSLLQKTPVAKPAVPRGAPKHLICLDISFTETHMTDKESPEDGLLCVRQILKQ